jgi:outer membrane protein assembly factor BamA
MPAGRNAPEVVTGVQLHLPAGADPTGFAELVDVRKGDRLMVRAVRRSIERLFATGRLADVVARAVEEPTGLLLIFDLTPKKRVATIQVEGNHVLTRSQLLTASRLLERGEYYPERIEDAARKMTFAYQRHGYYRAQIQARVQDSTEGIDALFAVQEGEPTRIQGFTVAGYPGLPLIRLEDALELRIGAILDQDLLDAGVERLKVLLRTERFYRARVGEMTVSLKGIGAVVALPLDAGPKYTVHFHGNRSFRDRVLRGVLNYDGSEGLDRALIMRMARRLQTFYQYRGFYGARVDPREIRSPNEREAVLGFDIEEGLPLELRSVVFRGNENVSTAVLRKLVVESVQAKAPIPVGDVHPTDDPLDLEGRTGTAERTSEPDPDPSSVFVDDAYQEAAENMAQLYREQGYLGAKVALSTLDLDMENMTAAVTFEVSEGPQTVVREISYSGEPAGLDLAAETRIKVGSAMSQSAIEQTRTGLSRALGRMGYLFATVSSTVGTSPDRKNARVVFQIERGPQVHVGKVILQGLQRTHPEVVRFNLQVRSGKVLDPEDLFESQRNLARLGIFRTVGVHLIEPEAVDQTKDVVVELRERSRLDGNLLAGYSLAEGPQVGVDALYPNLFGRSVNLSSRFKLNYAWLGAGAIPTLPGIRGLGGRANVSFQQPRIYSLLPAEVGARVDLVGERVFRPSYRFTRYAGIAGLDWAIFKWLNLSLQYELEHDRVYTSSTLLQALTAPSSVDLQRLRFPIGIFTLHSLRQSVAADFRDDPLNPRRGVLLSGIAEVTRDIAVYPVDEHGAALPPFPIFTLKLSGNLTFYVPLGPRVVLALSGRAGRIFQLQADSKSIAPKRFFLGGTSTLRGFGEERLIPQDQRDELRQQAADCRQLILPAGCSRAATRLVAGDEVPSEGGELFTLGKSELRFPILQSWDMGVFFEAGNLWLLPERFVSTSLRYTAGAGVRYLFPIGPAALDLGFNLDPDRALNEPSFQVHFSIGLF